jgi:hypothetical protein
MKKQTLLGIYVLLIVVSGWLFFLVPNYFKYKEQKKIDDEFLSLTIDDIERIRINFSDRFNNETTIELEEDDCHHRC